MNDETDWTGVSGVSGEDHDRDDDTEHASRSSMLERALAVLTSFAQRDVAVTPSVLAKRAGLSKATGHRIIGEMVRLGLLDRTTGGVRMGLLMYELGQVVEDQRQLRTLAAPIMHDLHETTKMTVNLAVLDEDEVFYVDVVTRQRSMQTRVSRRFPAYATAIGKAMLAFADPVVRDAALERPLRKLAPNTITDHAVLRRELEGIRRTGFASEREESVRGTACVGAAVRGANGTLQGGLSLVGSPADLDVKRMGTLVRAAAAALSRILDREIAARYDASTIILPPRERDDDGDVLPRPRIFWDPSRDRGDAPNQ